MKRVLIIAWYFPPDGGPGTQRVAKFCKYLPDFGWEPIVLTRPPPEVRQRWEPEDQTLQQELGDSVRVLRTPESAEVPEWVARLALTPTGRNWLGPAFDAALDAIREFEVDALLISMSPFKLSFVGRRLTEQTGLPLVVDLRDPWALDGMRPARGKRQWRHDFQVMSDTLRAAAGVVANTPESRRAFLARIPGIPAERVEVVPNGFDPEDFRGVEPAEPDRTRFRLVHTGSLHTKKMVEDRGVKGWLRRRIWYRPEPIRPGGRTLHYLLEAVNQLARRNHPLAEILEIVLVGLVDDYTRQDVAAAGLTRILRDEGYLPHRESVRWLINADALFLPLHDLPEGNRSLIVPGKAYEYLAAGRPILGCLPVGDARDLVERSGRGYLARPCDPSDIARALATLHDDWKRGELDTTANPAWIEQLERRHLTGRLASFMDRIVAEE